MKYWVVGFLVGLIGCTPPEPAPIPPPIPSYRDINVPISSAALFDPARYTGTWYEVARYPTPSQANCAQTTAEYALLISGQFSVANICRNPDGTERSRVTGTARVVGPGRLTVQLSPITTDYWVLWIDGGYRTAVVGAPDGRTGRILNRDPQIPPDRLQAARDILEFNGYDLGQLMEIPQ